MWLTVKEVAAKLVVSDKTVRRRCSKGVYESKYKPNPNGGKDILLIHWPNQPVVTTGQNINLMKQFKEDTPLYPPAEIGERNPGAASSPAPALLLSQIAEPEPEVPDKFKRIGQLRAKVCQYAMDLWEVKSKTESYQTTIMLYNNKEIVKELREVFPSDDSISEITLRRWVAKYKKNKDCLDLVPKYSVGAGSKIISEDEEKFLLRWYLNPNQIHIGTIIKMLKTQALKGNIYSPSSASTLRRWIQKYERDNSKMVALMRKGEKFVKDSLIKHIERDATMLDVGDVWVADGNVLNFQIINPLTGKPQRMIFVPWMDWRSRFIVGGSIAPTEDTMNIAAAFRNAVLNWGGTPRAILIDNGRAFKSKYFTKKKNVDIENELGGLFSRLKIQEHFATPYNAKAKPIERWFKTFNDGFERFLNGYRGASISDQPAQLNRNEKFLQKLTNNEPMELIEAQTLIAYYITNYYHQTQHKGIHNSTPEKIFQSQACPQERLISPHELNYLMLKGGVKKVGSNGIRHNKINYWHPKMANMVGQQIIYRYDWHDLRHVHIYSEHKLICIAEMNHQHHPMISLDPNKEISEKHLNNELKHQKSEMRMIKKLAKSELDRVADIDQKVAAIHMGKTPKLFQNPKLLETPKKKKSLDEIVAEIHSKAKPKSKSKKTTEADELGKKLRKSIGV